RTNPCADARDPADPYRRLRQQVDGEKETGNAHQADGRGAGPGVRGVRDSAAGRAQARDTAAAGGASGGVRGPGARERPWPGAPAHLAVVAGVLCRWARARGWYGPGARRHDAGLADADGSDVEGRLAYRAVVAGH